MTTAAPIAGAAALQLNLSIQQQQANWRPIDLPPPVAGGLAGAVLALALFLAMRLPRA